MILAHEAWFTDSRPPYDWSFFLQWQTLVLAIGAALVTAAWRMVGSRLPKPELEPLRFLGRLSPWVPRLLAVHAGVSLLAQAARGTYLAPSLELPDSGFGTLLAVVEGLLGVWLISGFRVRAAAALLVAAGPLGMIGYGIVPILERVDLLGIALFLAFVPPGEDRGGAVEPSPRPLGVAIFGMRTLLGLALIVLAFTEKLARPALALAFLQQFPAFNVLDQVGLHVSDLTFIRVAGAIELLFGLLVISGSIPQAVVIVAGIPFNATLFFLGADELIGHLPLYGAMLALLVYGSDPRTAPLIPEVRPWRVQTAGRSRRARVIPASHPG